MRRASFLIHAVLVGSTILLTTVGVAVAAQYPPKASTCAAAPSAGSPGINVVVKGTNWMPGTALTLSFVQDGAASGLGSATADAKGKFHVDATIPDSAHTGKAAIQVDGTGASNNDVSCLTNFQVVESHTAVAVLPESGTPITTGMILAVGGFVLALMLIHRRRNRTLGMLEPDAKRSTEDRT